MIFRKYSTCSICLILALLVSLFTAGCSREQADWNGKNIEGVMPDLAFDLVGTDGQRIQASDTSGQVRLLFFGYTSCPDVCPATLAYLKQVLDAMPRDLRGDVTALFVSVDPERDTPERLQQYVSFFSDRIIGLTGSEDTLHELAKRYRTTFGYGEPDAEGNYEVSHSGAIYVFDREGQIRLLLRSDLPKDKVAADLEQLVRESA